MSGPRASARLAAGRFVGLIAGLLMQLAGAAGGAEPPAGADWPAYAADAGGSHYSALTQIAPANVAGLKLAWSHRIEWPRGKPVAFEATPLKVGDLVYVCLPQNDVVALDADSGAVRWTYAAHLRPWSASTICRGLAYYAPDTALAECPRRLLMASADATLRAIDALTGAPCRTFGTQGVVDLLEGVGSMKRGVYTTTSAPAIVRGLAILGRGVPDNGELANPSGVVRAYDAVTGRLAWAWDLEHPQWHGAPPAGEIYARNTPNAWGPLSADESLGLVFLPTGNSNPDYYGAHRSAEATPW